MTHTYFFESRRWVAEGLYYSPEGESFALYGEVTLEHSEKLWELRGFMEVAFPSPPVLPTNIKLARGKGSKA